MQKSGSVAIKGLVVCLGALLISASFLGPAVAGPKTVAVFNNRDYIDVETSKLGGDESENMRDGLDDKGYNPRPFTSITPLGLSRGLAGVRLLVIPELGGDQSLAPDLSVAAVRTIREYVKTGGGLILVADYQDYLEPLMNRLFGFAPEVVDVDDLSDKTAATAGTRFANGPKTIQDNGATFGLSRSSLPNRVKTIYREGNIASVAYFKFGNGEVVVLGWDWYNAEPEGTQDGGWLSVLGRSAAQVAGVGCNVSGTNGPNDLEGTSSNDRICSFAGNDVVHAKDGNDRLLLSRGDDRGYGGSGDDVFKGGPGDDRCFQGPGSGRRLSC